METKLPESLQRQLNIVDEVKYFDSDNKNPKFVIMLNRMEARESVYEKLHKRYYNIDEKVDELCEKTAHVMGKLEDDLIRASDISAAIISKTDATREVSKLARKSAEYYQEIGKLMNDYGLIEILVDRNNRTFSNLGYPFLRANDKKAMDEFKTTSNLNTSYSVMLMKILVQINKLAKCVQDIEYGTMLDLDRRNAKINSDKRIKILSNAKTHYLRRTIDEQNAMTDEEKKQFLEEGTAKKEYERVFGQYFDNLDYEKELGIVEKYETSRKNVYGDKSALTDILMSYMLDRKLRKILGRDIKSCGIGKDENGDLVLYMYVQGYIMPLTVHISKTHVENMIEEDKRLQRAQGLFVQPLQVEKYKTLTDSKGKVFPTNLLYKLDGRQREILCSEAKKNPNDSLLEFFANQINKTSKIEPEIINASDLLK